MTDHKTELERRRVEDMLRTCPDAIEMMSLAGDELCRHAVLEHCAMGCRLWSQGAPVVDVLVTHGPVCISALNDQGEAASGAILLFNSHLIGEAEVFARTTSRPNEAIALEEQDVVRLPAHVFLDCVERAPTLCQAWLKLSNQRFLAALQHGRLASIRSAEARLHLAITLMISMGHVEPGGTVLLPCSQEMLGSAAALTRPAAGKVIAAWRKRGWIDTSYMSVRILHPEAFQL